MAAAGSQAFRRAESQRTDDKCLAIVTVFYSYVCLFVYSFGIQIVFVTGIYFFTSIAPNSGIYNTLFVDVLSFLEFFIL